MKNYGKGWFRVALRRTLEGNDIGDNEWQERNRCARIRGKEILGKE